LILGVGLGMSIGGIGMTHVAAYSYSAAGRLGVVKNLFAIGDEFIGLGFPDPIIARLKTGIRIALLNCQRRRGGRYLFCRVPSFRG
jgi:hypothetical protein